LTLNIQKTKYLSKQKQRTCGNLLESNRVVKTCKKYELGTILNREENKQKDNKNEDNSVSKWDPVEQKQKK